jgi:tetratricopeptide (TPR) repeat protein
MKTNNRRKSRKSSKLPESEYSKPATGWIAPAMVAVVTCVAFLPLLWNQFVEWDDYENLISDTHYRGLGWSQLSWMFTTFHMGPYQPLKTFVPARLSPLYEISPHLSPREPAILAGAVATIIITITLYLIRNQWSAGLACWAYSVVTLGPVLASSYFQEALDLNPDFADAYVALARALAAQGKKEDAEKHYQQALQLLKSQNRSPPLL